jgi:hypothetical protein
MMQTLTEFLAELASPPPRGHEKPMMAQVQYHQLVLLERLTIAVEKLADSQDICEDPTPCAWLTPLLPRLRDVWPADWDNANETEGDAIDIGEVVIAESQEANPEGYAQLRMLRLHEMDCVQLRDIMVVGRAYLWRCGKVKAGALHQLDTIMEEHGAGRAWGHS